MHEDLCELLGSRNVYYQPPSSVLMNYDAIRYELSEKDALYADNRAYRLINRYDGVVITRNADCATPDALINFFEMCSLGKPYTANNLYHFPFTLYY